MSFSVGHVPGQSNSYVTIYMTGGSFMVSDTPNPQNGQTAFGASSENASGSAQSWAGSLVPGTYFVGAQGDLSSLVIFGDAVSYSPAVATAPAQAPVVTQPATTAAVANHAASPGATAAALAAAPSQSAPVMSDQTQWVSFSVGRVPGHYDSYVTIYMTGGSFVLSNTPSAQPIQVEVRDPVTGKREQTTEQRTFGASSENPAGTAQIWAGSLVPGTISWASRAT